MLSNRRILVNLTIPFRRIEAREPFPELLSQLIRSEFGDFAALRARSIPDLGHLVM